MKCFLKLLAFFCFCATSHHVQADDLLSPSEYELTVSDLNDFICTASATISYNANDPALCNTCLPSNGSGNCLRRGVPDTASVTINGGNVNTLPVGWQMSWQIVTNCSTCSVTGTGTFQPTFYFDLGDPDIYTSGAFANARIRFTLVNYNCQSPPVQVTYEKDLTFNVCGVSTPPSTPPALSFPTSLPSSAQGIRDANKIIAQAFSPDLLQLVSTCPSNSDNGNADRITKVNYDGNWQADDNWEHVGNIGNYGAGSKPNAYYDVLWTDNFWIITYYYYWSRDYAKDFNIWLPLISPFICNRDEHEGDFAKVMVMTKRPIPGEENIDPRDLLLGYATRHHNNWDYLDCVADGVVNEVAAASSFGSPTIGAHIQVYSASGSHGIYSDIGAAYFDSDGPFASMLPCIPVSNAAILYKGGYQAGASLPIEQILDCVDLGLSSNTISNLESGATTEIYGLIDAHEPGGFFDHEDDLTHEGEDDSKILDCNNGNCKKAPGVPWNKDPIVTINKEDSSMDFDCGCREPNDTNCETTVFDDDSYVFNPYECEFSLYGSTNLNSSNSLEFYVDNGLNIGGVQNVNWTITSTPGNALNCIGCNEHLAHIKLSSVQDPCAAAGQIAATITAVIQTTNCGYITVTRSVNIMKPGPLSGTISIEEGPRPCPCSQGYSTSYTAKLTPVQNVPLQYNWTCNACEFTSETTGSQVFAKMVGECTYGPIYTVTVSNGCNSITSPSVQFPPCSNLNNNGGEGGTIAITPNPSSGSTTIVVHETNGGSLSGEPFRLKIYDWQSILKFDSSSLLNEFNIDATSWVDGVYYVVVTKGGNTISGNMVVSRH